MVMRLAADSSGVLFAAAVGSGLYRSLDVGRTWESVTLPEQRWHMVSGLATSATGALLVSDYEHFLRSTDGGESWAIAADSMPWALDIEGCGPDTLFAAVYSQGLYRSVNDGRSWHPFAEGMRDGDEYLSISTLLCRPDGLMLAGGIGAGMFYSVDGGEHWSDWNNGLQSRTVWSIWSDPEGRVYVGTEGGLHIATWPFSKGLRPRP